jgi:hypothetical protein
MTMKSLAPDAPVQRLAGDVLHDDEVHASIGVDVVNVDDVRVIESRGCFGFLNEAPLALRVGHHRPRQELDGDCPVKVSVAGSIDNAHAAFADLLCDPIVQKRSANVVRLRFVLPVLCQSPGSNLEGRLSQKGFRFGLLSKQAFDFLPKRLVAGARLLEECLPTVRFKFQGRVVELLDPLPALGIHCRAPRFNSSINQAFA